MHFLRGFQTHHSGSDIASGLGKNKRNSYPFLLNLFQTPKWSLLHNPVMAGERERSEAFLTMLI